MKKITSLIPEIFYTFLSSSKNDILEIFDCEWCAAYFFWYFSRAKELHFHVGIEQRKFCIPKNAIHLPSKLAKQKHISTHEINILKCITYPLSVWPQFRTFLVPSIGLLFCASYVLFRVTTITIWGQVSLAMTHQREPHINVELEGWVTASLPFTSVQYLKWINGAK